MIHARGLVRRFGPLRALGPMDLEIETGQTLALMGPNGAGKTTFLRLAAGLLRPTGGYVEIDGEAPRSRRGRIGFLGHQSYLYPHLTSLENLELYAKLYGVKTTRPAELLEATGMTHKSSAHAGRLSAGESKRVALARALLHDPDYLFLDEPFSSLDQKSAEVARRLIVRDERTTIFATHDQKDAGQLAQKVVFLEEGRPV